MKHQPVFKSFILSLLEEGDRVILDATLGEGGHTQAFLEAGKKVVAFERDPLIAKIAQERLSAYIENQQLCIHHKNYREIRQTKVGGVDLALFDLGISKFHYVDGERGFTFQKNEPLDMRLDAVEDGAQSSQRYTAAEIINHWKADHLADLFYRYGEETLSRPCARVILAARKQAPIQTSTQLAELIAGVYRKKKIKSSIHPATKIFQALRIEVNRELEHITPGVEGAIDCLNLGGKVAAISYHSLEDRLVKTVFRSRTSPRHNYNKYLPLPTPEKSSRVFSLFNKKVIRPNREEIKRNPSARSACLRILIRER